MSKYFKTKSILKNLKFDLKLAQKKLLVIPLHQKINFQAFFTQDNISCLQEYKYLIFTRIIILVPAPLPVLASFPPGSSGQLNGNSKNCFFFLFKARHLYRSCLKMGKCRILNQRLWGRFYGIWYFLLHFLDYLRQIFYTQMLLSDVFGFNGWTMLSLINPRFRFI